MAKKKIVILGATGMLGSMLLDSFVKSNKFDITATCRKQEKAKLLKNKYPKIDFLWLDVEMTNLKNISKVVRGSEWIVNAIGVIKPYIHDDNSREIDRAVQVNAHFPYLLAEAAGKNKSKILQIATDCVYSGQKGQYVETDVHDALDVYGKTKSLGEVRGNDVYHLRCSIIGPELKGHNSFLDWALTQPKGAHVNGFTNHLWNGITTLHFARICQGIINNGISLPQIQHIVPGNIINKADILKIIAEEYNRKDIMVTDTDAPTAIDRTLSTTNKQLNQKIWRLAGYSTPPTIIKMIRELAKI